MWTSLLRTRCSQEGERGANVVVGAADLVETDDEHRLTTLGLQVQSNLGGNAGQVRFVSELPGQGLGRPGERDEAEARRTDLDANLRHRPDHAIFQRLE